VYLFDPSSSKKHKFYPLELEATYNISVLNL